MLTSNQFFAAPFAIDGELVEIASWELDSLATKYVEMCRGVLTSESCFRKSFPGPFTNIEIQLTQSNGLASGTFLVDGQIAASTAYLRGENPVAEQEFLQLFIASMRRIPLIKECQATETPFASMTTIVERPLHIVIPWISSYVSDQQAEVVAELANHFAGAYLC